jgi:hypothetical protein
MAGEWSHTREAYENARRNLEALGDSTLGEVYREWKAFEKAGNDVTVDAFDVPTPDDRDTLLDYIWQCCEEQATCDNGGFTAWICPFGCHTVSFSKEEI